MVLTDTNLVNSALHWDIDYLSKNMGNGTFNVYFSKNNKFKYFDEKRADSTKDFVRPTLMKEMKFNEFVDLLKSRKDSDDRYATFFFINFVFLYCCTPTVL